MINKELILSLIKDDLKNVRLVHGLERLGCIADNSDYYLQLSETFFGMIGFGNSHAEELVYDEYCERSKKVSEIDIFGEPEAFQRMVEEIYEWLIKEKRRLSK